MTKKSDSAAPFAYEGLHRVIHERARLSVLTSLITHPKGLSFVELKQFCALTDGNLARHLQVLEEDNMVRLTREEEASGRVQTIARVTPPGRKRYLNYLSVLEQIVHNAAAVAREQDEALLPKKLTPNAV